MSEENNTEQRRGYVSTEHTVWCGGCVDWDQLSGGGKAKLAAVWKQKGWRYTQTRGWLCPTCAKQPVGG